MPVLFLVFWIILNGRITWDVLLVGIIVTVLVSLFTYKLLGFSWKKERKVWSKLPQIIGYFITLVIEVIKANVQMIALILSPKIEINPQILYFKSPVRSDAAKVALANSITLTPGTITVELEGDQYAIHAIDAPLGDGIESSIFVEKLKKIEGGHEHV